MGKNELTRMGELCVKYDVKIISDEIHSDLVYKPFTMMASISDAIANITITLGAPSKTFNVAGLNTAYALIKNPSLRRKFHLPFKKYDLTMGNVFGIEALIHAYESDGRWIKQTLLHFQENIVYIDAYLKKHMPLIKVLLPEATFLLWLDCSALGFDEEGLKNFFIKEVKLGLNTGTDFGEGGAGFMRLNIATSKEVLERAMGQLKHAYDKR